MSRRFKRGLGWVAVAVVTLGSGPCLCYDDECSPRDLPYCEGAVAVWCPDTDGAYNIARRDCAEFGQVCALQEIEARGKLPPLEAVCVDGCAVDCDCPENEFCVEGACVRTDASRGACVDVGVDAGDAGDAVVDAAGER